MSPTSPIQSIKNTPHAVREVPRDGSVSPALGVCQEGADAEVVGADPEGVDGIFGQTRRLPLFVLVQRVRPRRLVRPHRVR